MGKYIDADKLIAEIKIIQSSLEHRNVRFNEVKKTQTECMIEFCKSILEVINSLQQELPEVDLEKEMKESEQGWYNEAAKYWAEHCELNKAKDQRILILDAPTFTELMHEFYELGLNARKGE